MGRLRQGKNAKLANSRASKTPGSATTNVLKEQIQALGGDADDYELVKNAEELPAASSAMDTTLLSKDVRKFMKGLNLNAVNADAEPKEEHNKKTSKHTSKKIQKPTKAAPADAPPSKSLPEASSSNTKTTLPSKVTLNPKSRFIVQPMAQWHSAAPKPASSKKPIPVPSPAQVEEFTSRAATLHATDISSFLSSSSAGSSASEASFLTKIIQSGTLSDRLSALTLLVQSSPLHNTKSLETLRSMAERGKGKGGREESLKALRCIVDWWVGGGAPDRKLKYFRDQPLLHPDVTDEWLLFWYFEDWLKKYFFSILQILETLSMDTLPYVRTQSLNLIATLLRLKPEQEQNLLRLLVNKLGDGEKSLCSRASHQLLAILQVHPSMKSVVVREITALVLRPAAAPPVAPPSNPKHIRFADTPEPTKATKPVDKKAGNSHARYYSTITFNQIVLSAGDKTVALQLIDVYFEIFKELLGEGRLKDTDEDAPAVKEDDATDEVRKDKGGRIITSSSRRKGKKNAKEVKGAAGFAEIEDADSKLISALLTGVNRALPFAKLDSGNVSLQKHIDTLFLITHTSTFNISLQALVLIQQISSSLLSSSPSTSSMSASVVDRYYRTLYASLHDTRLTTSSKQAMYLNLLFKSIKADAGQGDGDRVKALVRRFVQILVSGGNGATEFVAGGLFLLGELFATVPGLRTMINSPSKTDANLYDPRKRDPQYAHASSSPLWELTPLLRHYHPAISLHARQLLSSQPLTASADLSLNTLSHFLDRFVYKNPKKVKEDSNVASIGNSAVKAKGSSMMQPAASGLDGTGVKLMKGEVRESGGLVNDSKFLKQRLEDVPVDQLFFHKYFARKSEIDRAKITKAKKRKGQDDSESEAESGDPEDDDHGVADDTLGDQDEDASGSDSEEEEIWKVMKATLPKVDGDDDLLDDDSDDLPSDFDIDDDDDDDDSQALSDEASDQEDDSASDAGDLSLVEASDDEDLMSLSGDVPDGLIEYDGSDADSDAGVEDEWTGFEEGKKRKREDDGSSRRKKLKSLPTFASYEDYAKMIEEGPEDDI